jgi:serine protease
VIQNANVMKILYGTGTYISQLSATTGTNMGTAYGQMMSSGVFDWLNEYNTTSPAQTIGRGSFGGHFQISPAAARNGATISDANIQAELAAQISAGVLPAPTDNNLYMFHFPAGKTITQGGSNSCQAGGFCAYHGTMKIGTQNVYYGVLPDMGPTSGCATGCGNSTTFNNQTSVASHELIEAITDAEVGLATVVGPPLAWYDATNGEIGDICNGQQGTFVGTDGVTYTIQNEFSNQANDCITTRTVSSTPDFTIAVTPASGTVAPGGTATFTVATTKVNASSQSISLSVAGLPSGVTGSFSPASVTAGGSSTLTVTASSTATGSGNFSVTGTSTTTHSASASLTVSGGGSGGGTLTSGVPVTGLSGAAGQQSNFSIAVPAGQTVTVQISGGTGDADLYTRAGAAPTLTTFDCRPFISGNNETCTATPATATTLFIMLNGFTAYSGVTLVATISGGGGGGTTTLTNNVAITGISGASGSQQFFKLTVPAGQTSVVFNISGSIPDADLYVRRGALPTTATFDCRPFTSTSNETCTFNNPVAADYFVMIRGFTAYSGVTLVGHFP